MEELKRISTDLQIRYDEKVSYGLFDAVATDIHPAFFQTVIAEMQELHGVVLAFGLLGDQKAARDFIVVAKIIVVEFTGAASILSLCANYLEPLKRGFIIGFTSLAGDRGR